MDRILVDYSSISQNSEHLKRMHFRIQDLWLQIRIGNSLLESSGRFSQLGSELIPNMFRAGEQILSMHSGLLKVIEAFIAFDSAYQLLTKKVGIIQSLTSNESSFNYKHFKNNVLIHKAESELQKEFDIFNKNLDERLIIAKETADEAKDFKNEFNQTELANELKRSELNRIHFEQLPVNLAAGFGFLNLRKLVENNPDILKKGAVFNKDGKSNDFFNGKMWCTSYAAARRSQIGNPLPITGAWGDAKDWVNSARQRGLEVNQTPDVGVIFTVKGGNHVGIVEKVLPDGTLIISEANYDRNGNFNMREVPKNVWANWEFIH